MKKQLTIFLLSTITTICAVAQPSAREEIMQNPDLAASNSAVYPAVTAQQTPAPHGKKPFYLSHYGRHGSRYLTKIEEYDYVIRILKWADAKDKLTPLGKDVLRRARLLEKQVRNRWGDMTELGFQQHRDIVRRMTQNYPGIYKGKANIDARSTLVPRCVLSMSTALQQLTAINPRLNIHQDASQHDLHYMNYQDKKLRERPKDSVAVAKYNEYCRQHQKWDRLMKSLFNDTTYIREKVDGERMNYHLFRLAGSIQNTTYHGQLTLYDIFTPDEIYHNWLTANASWYLGFGHAPLTGGEQPYTQRHLLKKLVEDADSCIRLPKPGAQLRFGHDTMVLPLVCLIDLNGYASAVGDLDSLPARGWVDYRVFPMACNLQFVFYRKNPKDQDVLVKILLNEREGTLPLDSDTAPYYRWSDVRNYFLRKLNAYEK